MVACYLLCPWLSQAVRDTELKSKGLYFRLLYLLWHSYGVDSLPICSWSRNLLFDWGFYLAQPFPSWFPSPTGILCRSFTSSHGFGTWPPLQWFFQLLNRRGKQMCHCSPLVNLDFTHMSPLCAQLLEFQVCTGRWMSWFAGVDLLLRRLKITWVFLQKCQLFSEKLTYELPDSRAVLTESSLGAVLSTGFRPVTVQTSFGTWYLLLCSWSMQAVWCFPLPKK